MITNFWLISVVLCLAAAGFVLIPLFRHRPTDDGQADRSLLNVELYRERLAELEKNQLEDEITAEQFASLKLELEQNLLSETAMRDEGNPETAVGNAMSGAQSRKIPKLVLTAALLVPLFAVTAYSDFGLSWGAINDLEIASQFKTTSPHDNDGMRGSILRLAKRLENQPENHDGWFLLGQSYMNLGEFEKSAGAYQHLLEKFPEDAGLSGYYAEALFLADDRKMTARVSKAIDAAYSLNPQNVAMLEIKAMNAFRAGELGVAVTLFEKALATGVEGERAGLIQQAIARLRAELGNKAPPPVTPAGPVAPLANNAPAAATKAADSRSAPIRSVQLLVEVADTVESNPNDSVFVYAKANAGPPMPLAVERMRVADLPRLVTLDETMGMMQGMSLANFDAVILVARISSSGIANTSPDDFQAASGVVDITSENPVIKLLIESRVRDQ